MRDPPGLEEEAKSKDGAHSCRKSQRSLTGNWNIVAHLPTCRCPKTQTNAASVESISQEPGPSSRVIGLDEFFSLPLDVSSDFDSSSTIPLPADMALILGNHCDFKYKKTAVEHLLKQHGYYCFYIPKFHCELNPIERVWGAAKRYTRAHCDYSFPGLKKTVNPALDSVELDTIRKFFRRVREYMQAYREWNKLPSLNVHHQYVVTGLFFCPLW